MVGGSNKEIMKQAFGKTLPHYKHIYLDMPGFGKSNNEMILTNGRLWTYSTTIFRCTWRDELL